MIVAFFWLLFAHLLADYPLQGGYLALTKGKNLISLLSHAGIWTGVIVMAATVLGYRLSPLVIIVWLFGIHVVADGAKARPLWPYRRLNKPDWPVDPGLLLDQLIHCGQLLGVLLFSSTR